MHLPSSSPNTLGVVIHFHRLFDNEHLDRKVHGTLAYVWFLIAIPAVLLWRHSVPFLVYVSVYANFVGHWSSYQAAKAEGRIEEVVAANDSETVVNGSPAVPTSATGG